MKLVSWNVNGLRACVRKGFLDYFHRVDADIFCVQETKLQAGQIDLELDGYEQYWNYAQKKGYSGTAVFTKHTPLSVHYGVGENDDEEEGRIDYFIVSERFKEHLIDSDIHCEVMGSDHCPVFLHFDVHHGKLPQ